MACSDRRSVLAQVLSHVAHQTPAVAPATDSLVSSCGKPWAYRVNQPLLLFGYFGAPA